MIADPALQNLEERIAACKEQDADQPLSSVAEICSLYEIFSDLYRGKLPKRHAHDFKDTLRSLADPEAFSAKDTGRTLYIMYFTLFAAVSAHEATRDGWLEQNYAPVHQVLGIITRLPAAVRTLQNPERDTFLDRLCNDCKDLSRLANLMSYLSHIDRMIP